MRRILPTTYAAIATTAAVGIVLLRLSFPVFLHQGITEAISSALPFGFQAREIRVDFLRNRAVLGGVLAGNDGFALLCPRVVVHFSLAGFRAGDVRIADVTIERPLLKVRGALPLSLSFAGGAPSGFPRVTASDGTVTIRAADGSRWQASGVSFDWAGETLAVAARSVTPPPSRYLPGTAGLSFSAYRVGEGWDTAATATWSDGDLSVKGRFDSSTGIFTGEGDYRGRPVAGFPLEIRKLHCSLTAHGGTRWGVDGTISSSTAVVADVPVVLTGKLSAVPEGLRIADLSALLPSGTAVVNGGFSRRDGRWESSGTALLTDIAPLELAITAGLLRNEGLPEVTHAGGSLAWSWAGGDEPVALATDLGLSFSWRGAGGPVRLSAEARIADGALDVSKATLTWTDNRLLLSGTFSPEKGWDARYELETSSLARTVGMFVEDFSLLDGRGSYRGVLSGPLGSPELVGEVSLAPFVFGNSVIERASGPLAIRGATLSSPGLALSLRGGTASVRGSVELGEETGLDIAGELVNYPIADLIGMFLPPRAIAARISTRFTLKGIEERSNGGGPATITGLAFGDITVGRIAGTLVWSPEGLSMAGARIESSVGEWSGDLALPFDGGIRGAVSTASLPLPPALTGIFSRAAGTVSLGGTPEDPSFEGTFRLGWSGVLAQRPDLVLKGKGNTARIALTGKSEGMIEAEGVIDPTTLRFTAEARGDLPPIPLEIPRAGRAEVTAGGIRLSITGAADDPTKAVGEASWEWFRLKSPTAWAQVETGPARVPFRGGTVTIDSLAARLGPLTGTFSGTVSAAGPRITGKGEAPVGSIASLVQLPPGLSVGDGTAEVSAAVTGAWDAPRISGEVRVPRCTVSGLPLIGTLPGVEGLLSWDGEKGTVVVSALYRESPLKASASITAKGISPIRVEGTIPASAFSQLGIPLLKEGLIAFSGEVPPDEPILGATGRVELRDGAATIGDRGRITALRGTGAFGKGVLTIAGFSGSIGEGEVTGTGTIDYSTPDRPRWDVSLLARGLFVSFPGEAELLLDADTKLTGTPRGSLLSGRITLGKGSYLKEIAAQPALRLTRPAVAATQVPAAISGVELDLEVETRRPFELLSNQADAAFEGKLRITGPLRRPRIAGEVRAVRGDFYYISRRFRIIEGSALFTGGEEFNPFIILSAATEVGKTTVYLNAQSGLANLTLDLTSNPPYGREDIVALLTFGQTVTGLRGKGEAVSAVAAATIVGGEILGRIREDTRRSLALSVFQIDPEISEGTGATDLRFTVGKKVTDRLYLSWSQRLTGGERQSFAAEYRILDFLTLTGERDSDGQNNFDLKVDLGF